MWYPITVMTRRLQDLSGHPKASPKVNTLSPPPLFPRLLTKPTRLRLQQPRPQRLRHRLQRPRRRYHRNGMDHLRHPYLGLLTLRHPLLPSHRSSRPRPGFWPPFLYDCWRRVHHSRTLREPQHRPQYRILWYLCWAGLLLATDELRKVRVGDVQCVCGGESFGL